MNIATEGLRVELDFMASLNCCGEDTDLVLDGVDLTFETSTGPCDCICGYDVHYVIELEDPGTYTFLVDDGRHDPVEFEVE